MTIFRAGGISDDMFIQQKNWALHKQQVSRSLIGHKGLRSTTEKKKNSSKLSLTQIWYSKKLYVYGVFEFEMIYFYHVDSKIKSSNLWQKIQSMVKKANYRDDRGNE